MKKLKIFIFISLAVFFFLITIYLFFYFLEMKVQGEYRKYDSGVTIEVNNLSNKALPDLKFLYSNSTEVGTVKSLEPGGTAKITGNSKEIKGSDISLYLNYYIENGGKKRG